jgi:hypothetical protein
LPLSEAGQIALAQLVQGSSWMGWLPISVLPRSEITRRNLLPAWGFMWALSFTIFVSLKRRTLCRARERFVHPAWRSTAYLLAWPGMDAESFSDESRHIPPPQPTTWLWLGADKLFTDALTKIGRIVSQSPIGISAARMAAPCARWYPSRCLTSQPAFELIADQYYGG